MSLETVIQLTQVLRCFTTKQLATIIYFLGLRGTLNSALTWTNNLLKSFVETGKLVKKDNYWHVPEYRGKFDGHCQKETEVIVQLFTIPSVTPLVKREVSFDCGLRADICAFLIRGNEGRCIIVEVDLSETLERLEAKYAQWLRYKDAHSDLEKVLGYQIDSFDFVTTSGRVGFELNHYLKEELWTS
jgi:hypothetical protein